jgi:peptide deformylase
MAKLAIVTIPDPVLTTKAEIITEVDESIVKLATDLKDTLDSAKAPEGAGIAANQIGIAKRMCIVRNFLYTSRSSKGYMTEDFILINPKIIYKSPELDVDWEGCLSVPDKFAQVARYKKIKIEAQTLDGNTIQMSAKDLFARVIQHEIDHLDGVLFTSRMIGKPISEAELDEMIEHGEI